MEYVQEAITTLHDFGDIRPSVPTDEAAVVVPMTEREHATLAAERVLSALESVSPECVVVPLRAPPERVGAVVEWLASFDLSLEVLWCDGPRLASLLSETGLNGARGKGRDVWLALGLAAKSEYVVVHDADAKTYDENHVRKLLFPLARGLAFSKGYYARVENDRLYGRLFRLLYCPLIEALSEDDDAAVLDFLGAFRYALAGEFATTGRLVRKLRIQRGWGLEVGTLGEMFRLVGSEGVSQIDLGIHEHDHRSVSGPNGLSEMSREVASALLRAVEENGGDPAYGTITDRYRMAADRLVDSYALDAAFNDFAYDPDEERAQIDAYAEAIEPPGPDRRLPAWERAPISPNAIVDAAVEDLEEAMEWRSVDVDPKRAR